MMRLSRLLPLALSLLPLPAAADERPEFWLDMLMAEPVEDEQDLWNDLAQADVIYLGETHRLARHHRQQVRVIEQLLANPRPLILGLEQIESRNQPDLDRFNRGEIDFEGLAKAIDWKKQWGNYEDYRALVETAREGGARIVGLNAPREIVRKTGREGIAGLEPEERAQLPETIHTDDPIYERLLNQLLSVHANFPPEFLKNVFEAQVARDDAMAQAIVDAIEAHDGPGKPQLAAVTGSGHVQFGLGTPDRVRLRKPGLRERILLMTESGDLELTPEEEAMRRAVEISHQDLHFIRRPAADYLYVKEQKPEKPGE